MKTTCLGILSAVAVAGVLAVASPVSAAEPSIQDQIAVLRASLKADRVAVVAEAMQFTEEEGKAFWPIYREYAAALDKVNDGLVKLVLEFADVYPNGPEERAGKMLKDYIAFEKKHADTRATYLEKFAKTLTSAKALRLAQVEKRLDLMLRLELASGLPLMATEKK
jgi:hypothetical protein